MNQDSFPLPAIKRIKERYVYDAIQLVDHWRTLYETRFVENGKLSKYTLDQAAEIVGVPRKTLEDYYYQLKRAEKLVDLQNFRNCKMGVIRRIVKESKKTTEETREDDVNQYFLQENETYEYRRNSFDQDD